MKIEITKDIQKRKKPKQLRNRQSLANLNQSTLAEYRYFKQPVHQPSH